MVLLLISVIVLLFSVGFFLAGMLLTKNKITANSDKITISGDNVRRAVGFICFCLGGITFIYFSNLIGAAIEIFVEEVWVLL